jgi:UDP-N-acetylmuramate--alanine ligase
VQGSDAKASKITDRLVKLGATFFEGQAAGNIGEAAVVVISSAIKKGNPELEEARRRKLPVVRRAEMLAELMRLKSCVAIAGTHGKTTTTSLVATLLDAGGFDPTVINGGVINAYGTNARLGDGEWMVVEADESDGTFLKLPVEVAIVTNIDPEHLDHFKTFEAVQAAFRSFVIDTSALLRLRRHVHRSSGGAGPRRPCRGPAGHHLWRECAGGCADRRCRPAFGGVCRFGVLFRDRTGAVVQDCESSSCRCPASTTLNALAAIAVAHQLGAMRRADPQRSCRIRLA